MTSRFSGAELRTQVLSLKNRRSADQPVEGAARVVARMRTRTSFGREIRDMSGLLSGGRSGGGLLERLGASPGNTVSTADV
jgi:hypothetical protein